MTGFLGKCYSKRNNAFISVSKAFNYRLGSSSSTSHVESTSSLSSPILSPHMPVLVLRLVNHPVLARRRTAQRTAAVLAYASDRIVCVPHLVLDIQVGSVVVARRLLVDRRLVLESRMPGVAAGLELGLVHCLFVFEGLVVDVDEGLKGWRKGDFAIFNRVVGGVDEEDFFAELRGITEDFVKCEALLQVGISTLSDSEDMHRWQKVSLTRRKTAGAMSY
jgi:hypothetical protein